MFKKLIPFLTAILIGILIFISFVVAQHIKTWCISIDAILTNTKESSKYLPTTMNHVEKATNNLPDTMTSIKEAADTSNMTSTQTLNLVGSATTLIDHVQKKVDTLDVKGINATVDSAKSVMDSAKLALDSTKSQIDTLGSQTAVSLKNVDTQIKEIGAQVKVNLEHLTPFTDQSTAMLQSVQMLIDGPVTMTLKNIDGVTQPTGLFVTDVQKKTHEILFPVKQSLLKKIIRGTITVAPLAQPTYYGFRLFNALNR